RPFRPATTPTRRRPLTPAFLARPVMSSTARSSGARTGSTLWSANCVPESSIHQSIISYNKEHHMGKFIDLTSADGTLVKAYIAEPAGKPKGGVVVIQEIFGVNPHIREVADGYAAQGYLAVAPATFQRVEADVELGYTS